MKAEFRTLLQAEANRLDCDLYRVIHQIEGLADRIPVAGPKLRGVANKLFLARPDLRMLMHKNDRKETQ